MRTSEKILAFVVFLMLAITVAAVAEASESVTGFVVVTVLVVVAGATQFFVGKFRDNLIKFSGEAFFEDTPPEDFDADAVFERAMKKRKGQTQRGE